MRHLEQSMFFYTVKTDKGIYYYECFTTDEVYNMANQDDLIVLDIVAVDIKADDIIEFCVYGMK